MTGSDSTRHRGDLAWANALSQALDVVARRRRLSPDRLDVETECEVSEAVAAAMVSLAADVERLGLSWIEVDFVARRGLTEVDRYRAARPPY